MNSVLPISINTSRRCPRSVKEKNIYSAIFSIALVALLISALAQPKWYFLKGGGCTRNSLGVHQFFYLGSFRTMPISINTTQSSLIYFGFDEEMKNCVTPKIVMIQRYIIALCSLAVLASLWQFYVDTVGVSKVWIKSARRIGFGSVCSVFFILLVICLYYYSSELMGKQQERTKLFPATKIQITFGLSYYLIAVAGVLAIIATAANLFRRYPSSHNYNIAILDDSQDEETFSVALPHSQSWLHFRTQPTEYMNDVEPPPPYAP